MPETVVILGGSDKKNRYSYMAFKMLQEHGHYPVPVHPSLKEIEGIPCFKNLVDVKERLQKKVDTITVYVNSRISKELKNDILALNPKRVIFNPGAENSDLASDMMKRGIIVEDACTLVLLRMGEF